MSVGRGASIPFPGFAWRRFPSLGIRLALAALVVLAAPAWAADGGRGSTVYQRHCTVCHGLQGEAVWPGAPDFRRPGSLLKSDAQLLALLRQGRGVMPGYLGLLQDRELADLLAFLRTLSR